MLLLDAPSIAGSLDVFADHLSPTTFHYLPGSPRAVRHNDRPGVQLLRYRAPRSGGLLLLDVELSHDSQTLAEARGALMRRHGAVDLVPVTFRSGLVRLVALGAESKTDAGAAGSVLVERAMGSAMPALFGHARAVFSVRLTAEGAALMHAALGDGGLPVAIIYELTFDGLRLARGARATVQYSMAYDFLRSRLRTDTLLFKGDLDSEVEALKREGLVSIADVDYQGKDPATLARRADELRAELAALVQAAFFRPGTSPATMGAAQAGSDVDAAWASAGRGRAAFVLKELSQREVSVLNYDLTVSRVAEHTIAPQGSLGSIARDGGAAVVDVDADAAGARSITVVVPPGADWSGVDAVEVTLEQNGAPLAAIVVNPARTEATIAAEAGKEASYQTRVLARPEPDGLGSAPASTSTPKPLPADTLVVDPGALSGRRVVSVALDRSETNSRLSARGALEAAGRSRPFALNASRPIVNIPVWGADAVECALAVELDETLVTSGRRSVLPSERLVLVGAPPGRHQLVIVEFVDPLNRLEAVFVEVEDANTRRRLVRVDGATPRATWSGSRNPVAAVPYRWNARTVTKAGRSVETGWRDGAGSLLLVGDTDVRVNSIELVLVGAPPSSIGAEIAVTSLNPPSGIDASISAVLESPFSTRVAVPFGSLSTQRRYRVQGTLFLEEGEIPLGPIESGDEVCLLTVGRPEVIG